MNATHGLRATGILTLCTLLEALRSRLVWVGLVFSIILIFTSIAVASVSLHEQARLIVDVGLAAASLVGTIIALSATLVLFAQELQSHTAYVTLSRPIPRWSLLAGKFLGLWIALWIVVGLMGVSTAGVVFLFHTTLPPAFGWGIFLTGMEMGLVIALGLLLITLSAPGLAAAYGAALLLAGNMSPDILAMVERQEDARLGAVLQGLFYVLPDLQKLSLRPYLANALPVPAGFVGFGTLYSLGYTLMLLVAGMLVFSRRRAL